MSDERHRRTAAVDRRSLRWPVRGAVVAIAVTIAFLAVRTLVGTPARLIEGCVKWIALAGILELLSVLGFVVVFKLVFGARMTWRQGSPAGLRALGASTVLPAGGLVGPAAGAWSVDTENTSPSSLTRAAIAFLVLTNAPGLIVLAALGLMLWLGWPSGPHDTALTLLPAGLAFFTLAAAWHTHRSSAGELSRFRRASRGRRLRLGNPVGILRDGVVDVRGLLVAGNWKLFGAVGYYAFDNAVLWAAFNAFGRTPPLTVIVMGYLIGSLATALPSPAGLGAVEGGLIGALVLYGAPAAPAAVAVLLYRSISLGVPLLLGALAWTPAPIAWLGAALGDGSTGRRAVRSRDRAARPSSPKHACGSAVASVVVSRSGPSTAPDREATSAIVVRASST
jgi:uncharacterized membrane protein YbhN (UPF0104 family)